MKTGVYVYVLVCAHARARARVCVYVCVRARVRVRVFIPSFIVLNGLVSKDMLLLNCNLNFGQHL